MHASRFDAVRSVSALIEAGADLEAADVDGWRPLLYASLAASTEPLRLLLAAGADIEAADDEGWTALMNASLSGTADNVRFLLEAGADARDRRSTRLNS